MKHRNTFLLYNPRKHLIIPLPHGWRTIVDIEDAWVEDEYQLWTVKDKNNRYVGASRDGEKARLHRLLLNPPKGLDVDHKNHDGLDNRRHNLRVATRSQNQGNRRINKAGCSSQYRGVYRECPGKWRAQIGGGGLTDTRVRLGTFTSEEAAARAYDKAALERWGEFATLNFPDRRHS